jgi:hypothetical protein
VECSVCGGSAEVAAASRRVAAARRALSMVVSCCAIGLCRRSSRKRRPHHAHALCQDCLHFFEGVYSEGQPLEGLASIEDDYHDPAAPLIRRTSRHRNHPMNPPLSRSKAHKTRP